MLKHLSVYSSEKRSVLSFVVLTGQCFFFLFMFVFNLFICTDSPANLTAVSLVMYREVCLVHGGILPCSFIKLSYSPVLSLSLYFVSCLRNGTLWTQLKCAITVCRGWPMRVTLSQNDINILSVQMTIFRLCHVFYVSSTG